MTNRKTIAAIALATATGAATVPALADDGDVRHAARLLEQARDFGSDTTQGAAAGEMDRERARVTNRANRDEKRWAEILKAQSLN